MPLCQQKTHCKIQIHTNTSSYQQPSGIRSLLLGPRNWRPFPANAAPPMPEEVAKQDPNAVSQTSPNAKVNVDVHQKLNGTESQRTPKLLELLDTQVFSGSVRSWVLLVISSRVSIVSGDGGPMFKSSGGHGLHFFILFSRIWMVTTTRN